MGRLSEEKNPERLIKIIRMLKNKKDNISVAIVGDGPLKLKVKELIESNDLKNNIEMYGFVSNPYPILKASKILILTSKWEGLPMVALEAQALGKPIVSTPVDGLKTIIKNGYNGYLLDKDEEIVKEIINILDNNYFEIEKNVNEYFSKINDSESYFKRIKDLY